MKIRVWGVACAMVAACGGGSASSSGTQGSTATTTTGGEQHGTPEATSNMESDAGTSSTSPAPEAAASTAPAAAITVTAGTETPIPPNLHPRVQIVAPRNDALVRTNRVEVRLHVTDWPAPEEGRHIHLILDNEPYRRIDDPSRPIVLENLSEGTHVLRAFPGWHTHESVKRPGAFAMVVFHIGNRTDALHFDPHAPLLTYSRPKGDYNGAEAERVLLDFYVANIPNQQLSPNGYRVRYAIDGSTTGEATSWVPYWIEHLADGAHTLTLDLLGPDGQPVAGPFNHTERTMHVNHAAPTPPDHTHPESSASPAPAAH